MVLTQLVVIELLLILINYAFCNSFDVKTVFSSLRSSHSVVSFSCDDRFTQVTSVILLVLSPGTFFVIVCVNVFLSANQAAVRTL